MTEQAKEKEKKLEAVPEARENLKMKEKEKRKQSETGAVQYKSYAIQKTFAEVENGVPDLPEPAAGRETYAGKHILGR